MRIVILDERRVDDGTNPEMLLPTGQRMRFEPVARIRRRRDDVHRRPQRPDLEVAPAQRGKFKSFFQEHVASRAQNRAIRALLSLRGSAA